MSPAVNISATPAAKVLPYNQLAMQAEKPEPATVASLLRQLVPISLSDVIMALGDPLQTTVLARLPEPRLSLAAMGIVKAVAHFLESPIIMVLHASTALTGGAASRRSLWSFVWLLTLACSGAFLFLNAPGVYEYLMYRVFAATPQQAAVARPAMLWMVAWPAFIAWRRYFQGMMIRARQGKWLGWASVGRLTAFCSLLALGLWEQGQGASIAARALIGGILVEAMLAQYFAHRCGAAAAPLEQDPALPQSVPAVARYYFPLASTMLVVWGGRALLVALVARAVDGPVALAAWPAAWGFCILVANSTRMVQQIIIAQARQLPAPLLLRFAATAGLICSTVLAFLAFTPVGESLLLGLLGSQQSLYLAALPVIRLGCVLPLLVAGQNALQGFCLVSGKNWLIQRATMASLFVTLLTTAGLIGEGQAGAVAAICGMMLGLTAEVALLARGVQSGLCSQTTVNG